MSVFLLVTHFFRVCSDILARWFWGSMLHKLIARLNYFPSILRMTLLEGPNRQWYNRIDETVILGALPFRSQTKEVSEEQGSEQRRPCHVWGVVDVGGVSWIQIKCSTCTINIVYFMRHPSSRSDFGLRK